jgi:hypothetical protein
MEISDSENFLMGGPGRSSTSKLVVLIQGETLPMGGVNHQ